MYNTVVVIVCTDFEIRAAEWSPQPGLIEMNVNRQVAQKWGYDFVKNFTIASHAFITARF